MGPGIRGWASPPEGILLMGPLPVSREGFQNGAPAPPMSSGEIKGPVEAAVQSLRQT